MDHIKLPLKSAQPVLKVPYLAQNYPSWAYDDHGFLEYPQRKGFDVWGFVNGQFESNDLEFACAMIQSWCWFGLVVEYFKIFGVDTSCQEFLTTDASGAVVVTSSHLPNLLRQLESMMRNDGEEERQAEQFEALDSILTVASDFVSEIDIDYLHSRYPAHSLTQANRDQGIPSVLDAVHLSIIILGQYLDAGATLMNSYGNHWGQSPYLQKRLLQAGWCRSETFTFLNQLTGKPACLYYIAGISRCTDERAYDHRGCTDSFRCNRENLDRTRYATRHVSSCTNPQTCPRISFEGPALPNINSIISSNRIPVVTIVPGFKGQKPSCSVTGTLSSLENPDQSHGSTISKCVQVPYVCISHVWSDGLGNLEENSIPQCQMLQLQNLVNKLFDSDQWPVHFWLDTLCVPLQHPLRRIAINSMRSIYKGACKVLVIDSVLAQTSTVEADVAELAMRVRVSVWGRRLWTFHEACLAQCLYYQYQDRALTLSELRNMALKQQFEQDEEWRILCGNNCGIFSPGIEAQTDFFEIYRRKLGLCSVEEEALSWMWTQEGYLSKFLEEPFFRKLSGLTNCLRYRWTSWLEDETICLSGLLGLKVDRLTSIVGDDSTVIQESRMQEFLGSLDEVPADLLFLQTPRLKQKGLGWMPSSFLGASFTMFAGGFEKGIPTNEGLNVHLAGLLLPPIDDRKSFDVVYAAHKGAMLKITTSNLSGPGRFDLCKGRNAIIFRYPLVMTELPAPGMVNNMTEGLWVKLEDELDQCDIDCLRVEFGYHVSVHTCAAEDVPLGAGTFILNVKSCGPTQHWCIG